MVPIVYEIVGDVRGKRIAAADCRPRQFPVPRLIARYRLCKAIFVGARGDR